MTIEQLNHIWETDSQLLIWNLQKKLGHLDEPWDVLNSLYLWITTIPFTKGKHKGKLKFPYIKNKSALCNYISRQCPRTYKELESGLGFTPNKEYKIKKKLCDMLNYDTKEEELCPEEY